MSQQSQSFNSLKDFYRSNPQKPTKREVERMYNRRLKQAKEAQEKAYAQENQPEKTKMVYIKKVKQPEPTFNVNSESFIPSGKQVQQMTVQQKERHVDYKSGQVTTRVTTTTTSMIAPKLCKYFMESRCVFGDGCFYSHYLPTETAPMPQEETITKKIEAETVQLTELEKSYVERSSQIIDAVVQENPQVAQLVGNTIYPFVQQLVNDKAARIVSHILRYCSIEDARKILMDYRHLVVRVGQAIEFDKQQQHEVAASEIAKASVEESIAEDYFDNISESTERSEATQTSDHVTVPQSEVTEIAENNENAHKKKLNAWANRMAKKQNK